jgi:hypothetical protein
VKASRGGAISKQKKSRMGSHDIEKEIGRRGFRHVAD